MAFLEVVLTSGHKTLHQVRLFVIGCINQDIYKTSAPSYLSGACVIKLITAIINGHMTVKTNVSVIKLFYGEMTITMVKWP